MRLLCFCLIVSVTTAQNQCLSQSSNNIVSMNNPYQFNGESYGSKIAMGVGTYTFTGVTTQHPFAISQNSMINFVSGTFYASDFAYNYYTGNIVYQVLGDFGTMSYRCALHGFMGGENNLVFDSSCTTTGQNYTVIQPFTTTADFSVPVSYTVVAFTGGAPAANALLTEAQCQEVATSYTGTYVGINTGSVPLGCFQTVSDTNFYYGQHNKTTTILTCGSTFSSQDVICYLNANGTAPTSSPTTPYIAPTPSASVPTFAPTPPTNEINTIIIEVDKTQDYPTHLLTTRMTSIGDALTEYEGVTFNRRMIYYRGKDVADGTVDDIGVDGGWARIVAPSGDYTIVTGVDVGATITIANETNYLLVNNRCVYQYQNEIGIATMSGLDGLGSWLMVNFAGLGSPTAFTSTPTTAPSTSSPTHINIVVNTSSLAIDATDDEFSTGEAIFAAVGGALLFGLFLMIGNLVMKLTYVDYSKGSNTVQRRQGGKSYTEI